MRQSQIKKEEVEINFVLKNHPKITISCKILKCIYLGKIILAAKADGGGQKSIGAPNII
jgi:hypothetical protein